MTTHTFRRVIQEVGVAARETPRMYLAGVRAFTDALGRLVQKDTNSANATSPLSKRSAGPVIGGKATAVRHGKKNRANSLKK
jgi:hypothetical protein